VQFRRGVDAWPDADLKFRSAVSSEAKRGVNFGGKYRLVERSCGTGCISIALLELANGVLFRDMPFGTVVVERSGAARPFRGLTYRANSRLLVVEGCVDCTDGKGKGEVLRLYFVWQDDGFRELSRTSLNP